MPEVHALPSAAFTKPLLVLRNRHERRIHASPNRHDSKPTVGRSKLAPYSDDQSWGIPHDTAETSYTAYLNQAVLLDFLGQQPIAFQRVYVDITGGVLAALWLSNAISKVSEAGPAAVQNGEFCFKLTGEQCEVETGISRQQQVTCRRLLVRQGLLSEVTKSTTAIVYRLQLNVLAQKLMANASGLAQMLQRNAEGGLSKMPPEVFPVVSAIRRSA